MERLTDNSIFIHHSILGKRVLYAEDPSELLFCENETNSEKCYSVPINKECYYKDGINNYIIHGAQSVNPRKSGTKAAFHFNKIIGAGQSATFRLRMRMESTGKPFP